MAIELNLHRRNSFQPEPVVAAGGDLADKFARAFILSFFPNFFFLLTPTSDNLMGASARSIRCSLWNSSCSPGAQSSFNAHFCQGRKTILSAKFGLPEMKHLFDARVRHTHNKNSPVVQGSVRVLACSIGACANIFSASTATSSALDIHSSSSSSLSPGFHRAPLVGGCATSSTGAPCAVQGKIRIPSSSDSIRWVLKD